MMDKKRPVLVTILTTIMAALGMAASAFVTLEWWNTYLKTGFSVLFLLTLAAMNLAITIPLSVTPLLTTYTALWRVPVIPIARAAGAASISRPERRPVRDSPVTSAFGYPDVRAGTSQPWSLPLH